MKPPVHLTCKLNVALQTDSDGNLFVWDLSNHMDKQKQHINRLEIRKLKFAPGAGNFRFLCLSSDGFDIFNVFGVNSYTHFIYYMFYEHYINSSCFGNYNKFGQHLVLISNVLSYRPHRPLS